MNEQALILFVAFLFMLPTLFLVGEAFFAFAARPDPAQVRKDLARLRVERMSTGEMEEEPVAADNEVLAMYAKLNELNPETRKALKRIDVKMRLPKNWHTMEPWEIEGRVRVILALIRRKDSPVNIKKPGDKLDQIN